MTDANKRGNLELELERSAEAMREAEALVGLGLSYGAISRAYYAAFHLMRALLMTRGFQSKTHAGVFALLNQQFVRPGLLPTRYNRLLGGLERDRQLADYEAAVQFGEEDAREAIAEAKAFEHDVKALLVKEGWLQAES